MAHNLNSMMYTGDKPWHGLGTKVESAQTSADAIISAGLNWQVLQSPVQYINGTQLITNSKHRVNYRSDNGAMLGIVGDGYNVLQNSQAFSFFDAIVGVKEAMYHTAGALGAGERIWLLAKLPGYIRTVGDDVTEKYLLLSTSHDGSSSVHVMFTPIRVVCQNTLNVAIGSASNRVKVRHTLNMGARIGDIQKDLGIINQRFTIFEDATKQLAMKQVTREALQGFIKTSGLVPKETEQTEGMSTRASNIMEEVSRLFEYGKGSDLEGSKGTLWGAFNAVVEYVDHQRGGEDLGKRTNSLLYGSGSLIKQQAFKNALELAK